MDWTTALELVVARTGHERYRMLCSNAHADRDAWRARILELADQPSAPPAFPSLLVQAGNALGAVSRVFAAAAAGEAVRVTPHEGDRRRAICQACPNLVDDRCALCGCYYQVKLELATETCPVGKWDLTTTTPAAVVDEPDAR